MSYERHGEAHRRNTLLRVRGLAGSGTAALRLYAPGGPDAMTLSWRINGYRARLFVWTQAERETLESRPNDARYHPSGVWCALRLD
jgi:hypothetical protein